MPLDKTTLSMALGTALGLHLVPVHGSIPPQQGTAPCPRSPAAFALGRPVCEQQGESGAAQVFPKPLLGAVLL